MHAKPINLDDYFEDEDEDDDFFDNEGASFEKKNKLVHWGENNTVEPLMVFPLIRQGDDATSNWITRSETPLALKEVAANSSSADESLSSSRIQVDEEFKNILPLGIEGLGDLPVTLAPSSGISYFYLHKNLGLPEDAMWKITLEAGTVLSFTVPNLEYKVSLLRRTMNLSDEDVRTILTKHPTILHMSADKNIAPTILFLVRALDLSKSELRQMILQYPCILCYSNDNLRAKIEFFLDTMAFSTDDARTLLVKEPKLMCAAVKTGLTPRMRFLHKEIDVPLEDLRRIIMRNPRVLMYSVERNLREKIISFFIMRLRMSPEQVRKMLISYPQILDYNLHDHMMPIAEYFTSDLGFSPTELRTILLKFPRLMTHSMLKIKHLIGYLRFELGMDAPQVKRVIFQAPQCIGLNTDSSLKGKVVFLGDTFDLSNEELRKVIFGMPTLIICGIESNLKPKAAFLLKEFGNDRSLLRDAILTQPTLLGYSLEKRIKPRMERIRSIGARPRGITVGITKTQAKFDQWLENKRAKIEKNGGTEPVRHRRNVKVKKVESETEMWIDLKPDEKKEEERRKARIVHWKR